MLKWPVFTSLNRISEIPFAQQRGGEGGEEEEKKDFASILMEADFELGLANEKEEEEELFLVSYLLCTSQKRETSSRNLIFRSSWFVLKRRQSASL
jgi:hypothetical protein